MTAVTEPTIVSIAPLPPAAPEVEQAILGALMLSPKAWERAAELIHPELFSDLRHRTIFSAAFSLWHSGKGVDIMTVCDRLRADGHLDEVGGPFYVSTLTNNVSSAVHTEQHCRILIEHHIARSLIGICDRGSRDAFTGCDALDLLDRISSSVSDLYVYTVPTHLGTAADNLSELTDGSPAKHYTFGIRELDDLAVFEAGLPHVFAGRPGIGKSIFCLEVCWHLTLAGNVLLFSPEMTRRQVQARIVAREAGVPYSTILRGRMDAQQLETVARVSGDIAGRMKRLKVDPTGGITPDQIRARTERAMKTEGVIAFAVDHLHKMKTGNPKTDRDDFARISQCMNGVTEVAKNTMLPSLVMCQLNREVEKRADKRPTMADLRGSGEIEQDAAVVGLLYREGYYSAEPPLADRLEVSVAKNRDGAVGIAYADIAPPFSRIGPAPHRTELNSF